MSDPFLDEALEGFDMVEGDHAKRIAEIQQLISKRAKKRQPRYLWWSVAASLLLCVVAGSYLLTRERNMATPSIALLEEKEAVISAPAESMEARTASEELQVERRIIAATPPVKKKVKQKQVELMVDAYSDADVVMEAEVPVIAMAAEEKSELHITVDSTPTQPLHIALNESSGKLDEVVIVGYGTEKKRHLTGSTSTITGRVAGVQMSKSKAAEQQASTDKENFYKYVRENIVYSNDSCAHARGKVILEFSVNPKTRRPGNIKVKQSLCDSSDKEAMRLLENGPEWIREKGKAIVVEIEF